MILRVKLAVIKLGKSHHLKLEKYQLGRAAKEIHFNFVKLLFESLQTLIFIKTKRSILLE